MFIKFILKDKIVSVSYDEITECDVKLKSALIQYENPADGDIVKSFCTSRLNRNSDGNYYQMVLQNLKYTTLDESLKRMCLSNLDEQKNHGYLYKVSMEVYYPDKQCLCCFCDVVLKETILGVHLNVYPFESLINLKFSIMRET